MKEAILKGSVTKGRKENERKKQLCKDELQQQEEKDGILKG